MEVQTVKQGMVQKTSLQALLSSNQEVYHQKHSYHHEDQYFMKKLKKLCNVT